MEQLEVEKIRGLSKTLDVLRAELEKYGAIPNKNGLRKANDRCLYNTTETIAIIEEILCDYPEESSEFKYTLKEYLNFLLEKYQN